VNQNGSTCVSSALSKETAVTGLRDVLNAIPSRPPLCHNSRLPHPTGYCPFCPGSQYGISYPRVYVEETRTCPNDLDDSILPEAIEKPMKGSLGKVNFRPTYGSGNRPSPVPTLELIAIEQRISNFVLPVLGH
jgi:hypothetical protein